MPLPQTIAQYTLLLANLALIRVLFSRQKRWCHHLLLQPAYKLHSCWYRHLEGEAHSLALILPSLRAGYTKYQPNQINILWHLPLSQQCENQPPLCSDANEPFSSSSLAQAGSRGWGRVINLDSNEKHSLHGQSPFKPHTCPCLQTTLVIFI